MGWTTIYHHGESTRTLLDRELTWEDSNARVRPIKSAVVNFSTYYAAMAIEDKRSGKIDVIGMVAITKRNKRELSFKEISEDCGPCYYDCPARILELLSPVDSDNAKEWREACWKNAERLALASSVRRGDRVLFSTNYAGSCIWYVDEKKGSSVAFVREPNGYPVRLKGWKSKVLGVSRAA